LDKVNIKKYQNLKIATLNIQALKNKTILLEQTMHENNLDILCITETFLTPQILSYNFFNYTSHRNDRLHKKGGGVAVLIRKTLKCRTLEFNIPANSLEFIGLSVQHEYTPTFNILCVYRTPCYLKHTVNNDLNDLHEIIDLLKPNNTNILLGDFNLRTVKTVQQLNNILSMINYFQMVDMPTRKDSILDLIITNNVAAITNIHTVNTLISDHLMVACTYSIFKTKVEPRFKFVRNYNKINYVQFGHDVLHIEEKYLSGCDEQLSFLNTSLLQVFNKHAPICKKKIIKKDKPCCITAETKILKKEAKILYSKYKKGLIK